MEIGEFFYFSCKFVKNSKQIIFPLLPFQHFLTFWFVSLAARRRAARATTPLTSSLGKFKYLCAGAWPLEVVRPAECPPRVFCCAAPDGLCCCLSGSWGKRSVCWLVLFRIVPHLSYSPSPPCISSACAASFPWLASAVWDLGIPSTVSHQTSFNLAPSSPPPRKIPINKNIHFST